MFCINCGTELPEEANFCFKCGKPQSQDSPAQEYKSEMCEIVWEAKDSIFEALISRATGQFIAKAIGPKGAYVAGKTQTFSVSGYIPPPPPYDKNAEQMLNALIAQLSKDGWEPVEAKGDKWFGHRFRRNTPS